MVTISLCMIVKNEEEVLARCLDSVKEVVDEIIIVDTGSEDGTKELAKRYTDQLYDFQWISDFSAARNFSFSKAKMDYIIWLDADDIILEEDKNKLIQLKKNIDPFINTVMMKYHTGFDAEGNLTFSYYRERMIRREAEMHWEGPVHEAITPVQPILYSEIAITHRKIKNADPKRNLKIFEELVARGEELEPRSQFYYGRELYYHEEYKKAIQVLDTFLDAGKGWSENCIEACKIEAYCYYGIGEERKALYCLLRSLEYDLPRAELCCGIGKHFLDRKQYLQAIFWYQSALKCEKKDTLGGFVAEDCYGYLPYIQLCICYDNLGEREKAKQYNEEAGKLKPKDWCYLQNKIYFQSE